MTKEIAKAKPRVPGRPFEPGHAGGPGRPKGSLSVAGMIRDMTDDGREIIEFFLGTVRDTTVRRADRVRSAEWLGDRVFGKVPDTVLAGALTSEERAQAVAGLASAELEVLARTLKPLPAEAPSLPLLANPVDSLEKPTD